VALNRALRLRKSSDFQRVRQQGQSTASRLLILAWTPNNVASVRIGFVISKRISKSAVQRNSIKRLLGEAIRPALADLPQNYDIVLSARVQVIGVDLFTLRREITTLLRRAGLLLSSPQEGKSPSKEGKE
jgi:ribonuclease P protein component